MGRRKDDPGLQKAKGYPGRRKRRTDQEIEAAADAAEREVPADPFAVPSIFRNAPAYYRRATEIWNGQAETLRAGGRRRPGYRHALTRYCIWSQFYEAAVERLRKDCPKGELTQEWTPVGGTTRIIPHPSLKIMGDIELKLRAIEDDFGFTPRADINLVRVETFNRSQQPDLFNPSRASERDDRSEGVASDPLDLMTDTDSVPPSARLN